MKKAVFAVACFVGCLLSAAAIDISLIIDFHGPTEREFREILGEKSIYRTASRPEIAWDGKDILIYEAHPYYLRLDTKSGIYTHIGELDEKLGTEYRSMSSFNRNDYILFRYGDYGPLADKYFGIYSLEYGWKDISNIKQFNAMGRTLLSEKDPTAPMSVNVMEPLLGPYALSPRPKIADLEELMLLDIQTLISLKDLRTGELTPLPKEYKSVRNDGLRGAVSFDRFKIAIIGLVVQETPDVPLHLDNRVYILDVVYDGTLSVEASLRVEPGPNGTELAVLPADTPVLVTDTAKYERTEDGREDFWYQVRTDTQSGWVFGGDLLIEGDDWKKRLDTRGRPVEWEELDEFLASYDKVEQSDAHEFEIAQEEQIDVVIADEGSTKTLEAEELARVDIASSKKNSILPKALWFLGIVVFLSVLFIVWERRKRD